MAFADQEVDGETAAAIARAVSDNPELARKLAAFRATRRLVREAFDDVLAEPAPQRLVRAALEGSQKPGNVAALLLRRPLPRVALPIAASVLLAVGIAGYLLGNWASTPRLSSSAVVAYRDATTIQALAGLPSGEQRVVHEGRSDAARLRVTGSYRIEGGYCRSFTLSGASEAVRGLGCKRDGDWRVEAIVADAQATSDGQYRPASGAADVIESVLDSFNASEPLTGEQEKRLIADGWKQ
jgi:hypothetical protein